jgi:hypothetical protein
MTTRNGGLPRSLCGALDSLLYSPLVGLLDGSLDGLSDWLLEYLYKEGKTY